MAEYLFSWTENGNKDHDDAIVCAFYAFARRNGWEHCSIVRVADGQLFVRFLEEWENRVADMMNVSESFAGDSFAVFCRDGETCWREAWNNGKSDRQKIAEIPNFRGMDVYEPC